MRPLLNLIGRSVAGAVIVGTATFGIVNAESSTIFSCCGNASTPEASRCRYTDRGMGCDYDSTCANDPGHTICCTNSCVKPSEPAEGDELLLD